MISSDKIEDSHEELGIIEALGKAKNNTRLLIYF